MRTLIAGLGYQNLRDLSVGPALVPTLRAMQWAEGVEVDDWSFGPIAVVQQLQDRPNYYDRFVFISAVARDREPGKVYNYRWNGALPDADDIQRRIGEAYMGVISLDNLLIITQYFGVLPREVFVVEVEPEDTESGPGFTPRVEAAIGEVVETVRRLAVDGVAHDA